MIDLIECRENVFPKQVVHFDDNGRGKQTTRTDFFESIPPVGARVFVRIDLEATPVSAIGMEQGDVACDVYEYTVRDVTMRVRSFLREDGTRVTGQNAYVTCERVKPQEVTTATPAATTPAKEPNRKKAR